MSSIWRTSRRGNSGIAGTTSYRSRREIRRQPTAGGLISSVVRACEKTVKGHHREKGDMPHVGRVEVIMTLQLQASRHCVGSNEKGKGVGVEHPWS